MALPFEGAGGVVAPAPSGPVGRIMQRVCTLRDISPSRDVLRAAEILAGLTKAEDAARHGLQGELLERLILHLSNTGDRTTELNDVVFRIRGLQPAVIDGGYV